jgi:L-ascorbate metabolism protein UlaG (beta-lactamase superfamily)
MGPKRFHPMPLPLADLPPLDAVAISHDHYDHLDRATVAALAERGERFVVPLGVGAHLEQWGIAPELIDELDWWEEIRVGELTLVATPGRHFSGRSVVMADRNQTLWSGWALIGPAHRVYYSGDTAMFPGFAEIGRRLGPFDVTMIEIGAYNAAWRDVHIGPEQAIEAHRMLRGELLLPVHWGTFDLALHSWTEPAERVLVAARAAGVDLALPRPGESVDPSAEPALTRWWPSLPFQTAEEAPVVSSALGPSAGLARGELTR